MVLEHISTLRKCLRTFLGHRMGKIKSLWKPGRLRPTQMKGRALNPNAAIEDRYYQALKALITRMTRETQQDIAQLFTENKVQDYFAEDAGVSSKAKKLMKELNDRMQDLFDTAAKPVATKMAQAESKSSAVSLAYSLKAMSGGLTIKTDFIGGDVLEVLNATIAENVALIKSIATQYLTQVQGAVMRSITTGRGLADLVPFLTNQHGVTVRRARIIAGDQTRKAFSNLNFARMDKIGIQEYEWLHSSGGQHPRKLHQRMSGNVYRIDKPPIIDEKTGRRGKPGDLINCRCRAIPIIKFSES